MNSYPIAGFLPMRTVLGSHWGMLIVDASVKRREIVIMPSELEFHLSLANEGFGKRRNPTSL